MLEQMLCWSLCPTAQGGPWPHGVPIAGSGSARTWPLAPTAISPSLPAQEASCPFGRMGEMEKAPPLPWANTAPLSSYPGERNSQVPAGTVTSPPGNAFPRPAGKGALVSLKELPGFPHSKPFPAVCILDGAGGCNFGSMGKGCYHFSQPGELGWAASLGVGSCYKPTNYCGEGEQAPFISPQLKSFQGPETQSRSMCLAFARDKSSPKGFL